MNKHILMESSSFNINFSNNSSPSNNGDTQGSAARQSSSHEEVSLLSSQHLQQTRDTPSFIRAHGWLLLLTCMGLSALVLSAVAVGLSVEHLRDIRTSVPGGSDASPTWQGIRKIAFGSCTAYDLRSQPVWTQVSFQALKLAATTLVCTEIASWRWVCAHMLCLSVVN